MSERCSTCNAKERCRKKPTGSTNESITIDMVFHRRSKSVKNRKSPLCDNLLCVEVKMKNATEVQLKCDKERVKLLVSNADGDARLNEPKYLMGATVHFLSSLEAEITFYDGMEEIHKRITGT